MTTIFNHNLNTLRHLLFLLILLLAACNNSETTGDAKTSTDIDSFKTDENRILELDPDELQTQVDTSIAFLKTIKSGPLTRNQVIASRAIFKTHYQDANPGLKVNDVKVKMDQRMAALFTKYPNEENLGLVFHYGYMEQSKALCYIMSLGSRNASGSISDFSPFPADTHYPNEYYILLSDAGNSGTYSEIEIDSACSLVKSYYYSLDALYLGMNGPVSSVPDHPLYVFHEGKELNEFYSTYYSNYTDLLYLRHIAGPIGQGNINYQAPAFISVNSPIQSTRYSNKALDLGHLCPTKCNVSLIDRCTP